MAWQEHLSSYGRSLHDLPPVDASQSSCDLYAVAITAFIPCQSEHTMLNGEPNTTSDVLSGNGSVHISIVPAPLSTQYPSSHPETRNCPESAPNRSWNYRVIEFVTEGGEIWRSIHEVHYVEGVPMAYSERPAPIMWEKDDGEDAALVTLEQMREALSRPVLGEIDFHLADSVCIA